LEMSRRCFENVKALVGRTTVHRLPGCYLLRSGISLGFRIQSARGRGPSVWAFPAKPEEGAGIVCVEGVLGHGLFCLGFVTERYPSLCLSSAVLPRFLSFSVCRTPTHSWKLAPISPPVTLSHGVNGRDSRVTTQSRLATLIHACTCVISDTHVITHSRVRTPEL